MINLIELDNAHEIELAAREMNTESTDLLDLVDDREPDNRSEAQVKFMNDLITNVTELDATLGRQAREYTDRMTAEGRWTPGREGNASAWITRLLAKLDQLRVAARPTQPTGPAPAVEIPAGRYAVETDEIRCYAIDYGREGTKWAGFLFLARISSDDQYPIRNAGEKARILAAIAADVDASAVLAARTLRQCRRCGRTLSDTKNPYFEMGLGPDCGTK